MQDQGISGLTDEIRQAVVMPGEAHRSLPAPARLLQILRDSKESFPLTADTYEDDTGETMEAVLTRAGFTIGEAFTLWTLRVRGPLMERTNLPAGS